MARAVERAARVIDVDALKRGGEAVGVALATDFAVGDDVEAGGFLRANGEARGVVLRPGQQGLGYPPQPPGAHPPRETPRGLLAVAQPLRVGEASPQGGREKPQG